MALVAFIGLGVLALVLFRVFKIIQRNRANHHPLVVQAKNNWPILGHAMDFTSTTLLNTAMSYPRLYGDFVEFFLMSKRSLFITDAAIAKEVMIRNPKRFRRLRAAEYMGEVTNLQAGLFHCNGPIWSKIRRGTSPSFSNQNMANKFPAVAQEIKHWIANLATQADSTVDMTRECMSLTLRVITVVAFGLGTEDPFVSYFLSKSYLEDVFDIFTFSSQHLYFPFPLWVWKLSPMMAYETKARAANSRFTEHCAAILTHKRHLLAQHPHPSSMIDHLIVKEQQQGADMLNDEEIVANVKTFYLAGAETTSITIAWSCYYLSQHPEVVAKLRQETDELFHGTVADFDCQKIDIEQVKSMQYANAVVKEILRIAPPAFVLGFDVEEGIESIELSNGIRVNQGDTVWLNYDGLMAREDVFSDAKAFNPDRWMPGVAGLDKAEDHFMPFGFGPRICPGMTLALTEAVLAVAMLAHTFDMTLDCPVEEIRRIVIFAAASSKMPVKFSKRKF